jgi:hypothetical protein
VITLQLRFIFENDNYYSSRVIINIIILKLSDSQVCYFFIVWLVIYAPVHYNSHINGVQKLKLCFPSA